MRQTMENPWYPEENDLQMAGFPLFLFAGGGYVGISLVAKNIKDFVEFLSKLWNSWQC